MSKKITFSVFICLFISAVTFSNTNEINFQADSYTVGFQSTTTLDVASNDANYDTGNGANVRFFNNTATVSSSDLGSNNLTLSNGQIIYTAPPGVSGVSVDSFSYRYNDNGGAIVSPDFQVTITIDNTAPSGYAIANLTNPVNIGNQTSISFDITGLEASSTYSWSITDGSTTVTGNGSQTNAGTATITGDVSSLNDGTLTVSATSTDQYGNPGSAVTSTTTKDATAPNGYAIANVTDPVNNGNATTISFDVSGLEANSTFVWSITDINSAIVNGSGSAASATISSIDVSSLSDGTLTVSVTATDENQNPGAAVTATTIKDVNTPSGYAIANLTDPVNLGNQTSIIFDITGLEANSTYNWSITDGSTTVSGNGSQTNAGTANVTDDVSSLNDGTLTVSVTSTDENGNPGAAVTATTTKDATVPSGYAIASLTDPVFTGNATTISFDITGLEASSTYSWSITDGATTVSGNGSQTNAGTANITDDVSSLGDGTLTVSVISTDENGNPGAQVQETTTKDTNSPTINNTQIVSSNTNDQLAKAGDAITLSFTSSEAINAPTVFILGQQFTANNTSGNNWSASYTVQSGDADGLVGYSITGISDIAGNTASNISGNGVTVDNQDPVISNIQMVSNNANTGLAKVGDEITLTFDSSETINAPLVSIVGESATVSSSGNNWTATYTVQSTDTEGAAAYIISSISDIPGNSIANETGTGVIIDRTPPSGYAIANLTDPVFTGNATTISFEITGLESSSTYNWSITDGSTTVTGNGSQANAGTATITDDVSSLGDGTLTVSVTSTDETGNTGASVQLTTTKDTNSPTISNTQIVSNNSNDQLAISGDVITVSFTSSEAINAPTVSILGQQFTANNTSGNNWSASYTVQSGDVDGLVGYSITGISDIAGNTASNISGNGVTVDNQDPVISNIQMVSNNTATGFSKEGDEITLTFDSSETINAPLVSIAGESATVSNSGNNWTATYTVQSTDTEGAAAYEISSISDIAGNSIVNETGTGVIIDTTAPIVNVTANTIDVNINTTTTITTATVNDGSSDNLSGSGDLVLSLDQSTFGCSDIVQNQVSTPITVTLTVTDEAGNAATATKTVNVIDDVAPTNVALVNPTYVHPTATAYVEQGFTQDEVCLDRFEIISSDLDVNQWGTYTIVYKLIDKSGNESAPITRTQVVNNVPTTDAANFTVNQDTENHVFDVLDGDSFGPDGAESFTISGAMSAQNGTLVLNDFGTADPTDDLVIYTPRATYNGPDSFTYTLEDENGDTVTTTVNIVVRPIVPVPVNDAATVEINSTDNIIDVLANDDFGGNEANATHPLTFPNGSKSSASINGGLISIEDNGTANDLTDDVIFYSPAENFTGTDTFNYTITDFNGDASTATVTVTVSALPPSADPAATDDAFSVAEDSTNNDLDILDNDSFGSEGLASITLSVGSNGGTLAINDNTLIGDPTDDTVTYTPVTGYVGVETFTYTLTDAGTDTDTATVTVTVGTVIPPSTTPTAVDDTATVGYESTNTVIAVLANDSYGTDGLNATHPLTLVNGRQSTASVEGGLISVSDNGTALDRSDDVVLYSAPAGFSGADSFEYTITDLNGDASTATVNITVNPVPPLADPTAEDDTFSVLEDSTNNDLDILDNDSFGSEGLASITLSVGSNGGTLAINDNTLIGDPTDDTVTYTPVTGYVGVETFTYTLTDAGTDTDTATVTIAVGTVVPPADTPTAVDDTATVVAGSSDNVIDVLVNDTPGSEGYINNGLRMPNGTLVSASVKGSAISIDTKGTLDTTDDEFNYTPSALATADGTDSFDYTITDTSGDASTGTVTVTVSALPPSADPTATDDAFSVAEDSTNNDLDILDNDSFGSEGAGSITLSVGSNGGTLAINDNTLIGDPTDDTVTYTPVGGFVGEETFTYTLEDAGNDTDTATVTVTVGTVIPPATTPTAVDDTATVGYESTNTVIAVLANDSYGTDGLSATHPLTLVNGKQSTASVEGGLISVSDNGTALDRSDDVVLYSAPAGFSGADSFEYTITDLNGDASTATVNITVNPVPPLADPTAEDDSFSVLEDSTNNDLDILDNDSFGSEGLASITLSVGSNGGTLAINDNTLIGDPTDDTVTYTPVTGYVGVETFTYTLTDAGTDTDTATVTIAVGTVVPPADTPTAVDDTATVDAGSSDNVIDVLVNDTPGSEGYINNGLRMPNGTLISASVKGSAISIDTKGTPATTDDEFNYTPSALAAADGTDSFDYTITDASGDASTGTVTVTITAVVVPTDEPSAVADTATTVEDTTVSIDVLDNDAYGTDGASTTVAPLTVGATSDEGGALSVLAGEITYTPAAGFVGTDTFEYTITDDTGDTATATVTVTVTAAVFVNGTPTANDDSASVVRFSTVNYISVLGNDDFGTDGPSATHPLTLSNGRSTGVTTGGRTISVHDNGTPNVLTDDTIQYSPGSLTSDSFEYTITDANGDANTGTVFITTTAVKSVTVGSTEVFVDNFMSYPNPSRGNVTTTLLSSVNTKANMMLFDVTGKVVYSSELDLQEGVNKFDFNFKVKAGILYMKIVSAEKDFGTSKIIFK